MRGSFFLLALASTLAVLALSAAVHERDRPMAAVTPATTVSASPTPAATPMPPPQPTTTPSSVPTSSPTATPPPAPAQPPAFATDTGLQAALETALDGLSSHVGVYVKRLDDGAGAQVDAARPFGTASLFKAYVMWEAFRQREAGALTFAQTMLVTPYYKSWELGTGVVQAGDVVTVDFALRMMMSVSDTPTAVLLQDTLGVDSINASLQALGIEDSGLFYPGEPIATAQGYGRFLEAVYNGTGVGEASRDEMIALMLSEQIDYGLRSGIPADVAIAHKTGSLPGLLHDAGIVLSPGGDYVIVVLTDGIAGSKIVDVSRAVYEYFNPADAASSRSP